MLKKLFNTCILSIVIGVLGQATVSAETKAGFYKRYISNVKVSAQRDANINEKILVKGEGFYKNDFDIYLASDLLTKHSDSFTSDAIVICDTAFSYKDIFYCDTTVVEGANVSKRSLKTIKLASLSFDQGTLVIIPEELFVVPRYEKELRSYLVQLYKSKLDVSASPYERYSYIDEIYTSSYTKVLAILGSSVFFLLLLLLLLKNSRKVQDGALLIFTLLSILAVPLSVFAFIHAGKDRTISAYFEFIRMSFDPFLLIQSLLSYSFEEMVFVFILHFLVLLGVVFIVLPHCMNSVLHAHTAFAHRKLKESYLYYIAIALMFLGLLPSIYAAPYLIFLLLFLLICMNNVTEVHNAHSFAIKTNITQLFILCGVVIGLVLTSKLSSFRSNTAFSVGEMAVLPVHINTLTTRLNPSITVKTPAAVGVDNFIVYHPRFTNLIHRPLEDFDYQDNAVILLDTSKDKIFSTIHANPKIRDTLLVKEKTNYMYLTALRNRSYSLKIVFNCTDDLESIEADYKPFYYNERLKSFVTDASRIRVFNLNGCSGGLNTYTVPLVLPSEFTHGSLYLKFNLDVKKYIESIQLIENGVEKNFMFLNLGKDQIAYQQLSNATDPLYIYTAIADEQALTSSTKLIPNIKLLLQKNLVSDNFTLWSDQFGVVLSGDLP